MPVDDELDTLGGETISLRDVARRAGDVLAAMMRLLPELWGLSEGRAPAEGRSRPRQAARPRTVDRWGAGAVARDPPADPRRGVTVGQVREHRRPPPPDRGQRRESGGFDDRCHCGGQQSHRGGAGRRSLGAPHCGIGGSGRRCRRRRWDRRGLAGDALCGALCALMGGAAGAAGLSILAQEHL